VSPGKNIFAAIATFSDSFSREVGIELAFLINDSSLKERLKCIGFGIKTEIALTIPDFLNDNRSFVTRVYCYLSEWCLEGFLQYSNTHILVFHFRIKTFQCFNGSQKCHTTTNYDPLFYSSPGCVQGVLNPVLFFIHFDFGGSTIPKVKASDGLHGTSSGGLLPGWH